MPVGGGGIVFHKHIFFQNGSMYAKVTERARNFRQTGGRMDARKPIVPQTSRGRIIFIMAYETREFSIFSTNYIIKQNELRSDSSYWSRLIWVYSVFTSINMHRYQQNG